MNNRTEIKRADGYRRGLEFAFNIKIDRVGFLEGWFSKKEAE